MKKLLTILCLLTVTIGYSQIPKPQTLTTFSTWSVMPYGSFTHGNTDVEGNPLYKRTNRNRGLGLEINKQLSHFSSIQLNGFKGSLESDLADFRFTSALSQLDLRFRLNITNGAMFRTWQSTQLYTYIGYGILWYDATKSIKSTGVKDYQVNDIARVVPVGLGVKYRLGNRTSLSGDLSYNPTNTDKLDSWINALTSKDGFTRLSVGLTYNLGKNKILEWDQPWAYLVPESVHDTTVVIQKIEYTPPKVTPVKLDSATIYYLANNYQIEEFYLKDLDDVLTQAQKGNLSIEIMAYCDSSGTSKGNYDLVTKRADKVVQYAKTFIDESRIFVFRYDEAWAIYAPEARNRKVIVKLIR